ncbi:MAG: Uma2 family endonuclease [Rhizobiaceae bacterium]|nr:Uma2 family endonuclease [Rhizobiaceae bacterium]
MNKHVAEILAWPETTQAADGMPRRPWTVAEIEAIVKAGIIPENERFELIGGEVVPMPPKGGRHEMVKIDLNRHFQKITPDNMSMAPETTLRLNDKTFLEPDFCLFPRSVYPSDMRGYDVLLAVEIGDSSLAYDRGRKLSVYAAFGIPEVWVIDANRLITHVYRQLGAEGYRSALEIPAAEEIACIRLPTVAMCLARLGLKPL